MIYFNELTFLRDDQKTNLPKTIKHFSCLQSSLNCFFWSSTLTKTLFDHDLAKSNPLISLCLDARLQWFKFCIIYLVKIITIWTKHRCCPSNDESPYFTQNLHPKGCWVPMNDLNFLPFFVWRATLIKYFGRDHPHRHQFQLDKVVITNLIFHNFLLFSNSKKMFSSYFVSASLPLPFWKQWMHNNHHRTPSYLSQEFRLRNKHSFKVTIMKRALHFNVAQWVVIYPLQTSFNRRKHFFFIFSCLILTFT